MVSHRSLPVSKFRELYNRNQKWCDISKKVTQKVRNNFTSMEVFFNLEFWLKWEVIPWCRIGNLYQFYEEWQLLTVFPTYLSFITLINNKDMVYSLNWPGNSWHTESGLIEAQMCDILVPHVVEFIQWVLSLKSFESSVQKAHVAAIGTSKKILKLKKKKHI